LPLYFIYQGVNKTQAKWEKIQKDYMQTRETLRHQLGEMLCTSNEPSFALLNLFDNRSRHGPASLLFSIGLLSIRSQSLVSPRFYECVGSKDTMGSTWIRFQL
jgi:hypothetical protein